MWETSFEGDLRPRRRFLDESHLRLTKVTWQLSVQGNWPPSRYRNRSVMKEPPKHSADVLVIQNDVLYLAGSAWMNLCVSPCCEVSGDTWHL